MKRVVDFFKSENQIKLNSNSSIIGLNYKYFSPSKSMRYFVLIGIGSFLILSKWVEVEYVLTQGKRTFLEEFEKNSHLETSLMKAHLGMMIEYTDDYDYTLKEDMTGITDYRYKLVNKWATGVILETCITCYNLQAVVLSEILNFLTKKK